MLAEAEAILGRRSAQFAALGGPPPVTLESIGWTLDELLEEAEDGDYASQDRARVRDLSIARDLIAVLQAL